MARQAPAMVIPHGNLHRPGSRAGVRGFPGPLDAGQLLQVEHGSLRNSSNAPPEGLYPGRLHAIFSDPVKVRFFLNSYLVASLVTLLTLLVAIMSGYSFSRYTFKLKKPLNLFIISTQTVPPITLLIPYFGLVVVFKMYNTYFALIFTYMVFTLPYAILMMTGYFNTLPREIDEAVMIDGGSSFFALWRVLVPISVPGIVATACIRSCWRGMSSSSP